MLRAAAAFVMFVLLSFSPVKSIDLPEVDIALVLAVDTSSSVNQVEYRIQRDGIVDALLSPEFLHVLKNSMTGRVAINYMEWSGMNQQKDTGWIVIEGPAQLQAFANKIMTFERDESWGDTAMTSALRKARELALGCPCQPLRRVIDVSGDGKNNEGGSTNRDAEFRAQQMLTVAAGITINGLPILGTEEPDLMDWYTAEVIGGVGAFAVAAKDHGEFARIFLMKLLRETS
jgi:hypothetical protein